YDNRRSSIVRDIRILSVSKAANSEVKSLYMCISLSELAAPLQFAHFEHDHIFIDRLQKRVLQAGATVQESALDAVKQPEFEHRAARNSIEKLLLVIAALVEISGGKSFAH